MSKLQNLIDVKNQLAEKYENLARLTKSTPKRKSFVFRAKSYRRQAEEMSR